MKNLIVFLFLLCFSVICMAQEPLPRTDKDIDEVVVSPPQFTGIKNVVLMDNNPENMLQAYIQKNINYPEEALENFKEGTEVIEFVVTENGELRDFEVINSVSPEIDAELIRVLKETNGMWRPGFNNTRSVDMPKEVSVPFCCSVTHSKHTPTDHFYEKAEVLFTHGTKNMFLKHNYKKALKNFNAAVRYLPYDNGLLINRGICLYQLGDKEGARKDWERIVKNGSDIDMSQLALEFKDFEGYSELAEILRNK